MNIVPAVTSKWAKGSGGPAGDECQNLVAACLNSGDHKGGFRTEPGEHLVAMEQNQHAVAFQTRIARNGRGQPKEITDALTSCEGGPHADSKPHVTTRSGVRRLTPRECARLQGFPDDWLDLEQPLSDSAKYRCLGNAVAVPVADWLGRRIKRLELHQLG